jgi:hypothetical protein
LNVFGFTCLAILSLSGKAPLHVSRFEVGIGPIVQDIQHSVTGMLVVILSVGTED